MSDATNGDSPTAAELARNLTTPEGLRSFARRMRHVFDGAADPGAASELIEALVALDAAVTFSRVPTDSDRDVLVTLTRQPLVMQASGETVEEALALAALTLSSMGGIR